MSTSPLNKILAACVLLLSATQCYSNSDMEVMVIQKAGIALKHWEYSRTEFEDEIRLSVAQKEALKSLVAKGGYAAGDIELGLMVLASINCVEVDSAYDVYRFAYEYLCVEGEFAPFIESAAHSFDGLYMLSFTKERDKESALAFLREYIELLKRRVYLSGSNLEYLEEIYLYIEGR